jgi:hypothetical protein
VQIVGLSPSSLLHYGSALRPDLFFMRFKNFDTKKTINNSCVYFVIFGGKVIADLFPHLWLG